MNLFNKLFLNPGNAKTRFIQSEKQFTVTYEGSHYDGVPDSVKEHWQKIWQELNKKDALEMSNYTHSSNDIYA